MQPERPRITVVNDNAEFLSVMQDVLQDGTYPATLIDGDRENALELIEASNPGVLVIDLRMGAEELHGMDIVRAVRERPHLQAVPILVCSADQWALANAKDELEAMDRVSALSKPFTIDELYAAIERLTAPA
jgi:CheY-like chemotaxis protein